MSLERSFMRHHTYTAVCVRILTCRKKCEINLQHLTKMRFMLIIISCLSFISCSSNDIPSLPYCPETELGLLIVSTLDGKISALNSSGSLVWEVNTAPGPLLLSNIHNLELTNNGEWIRIIPSLTGTLYKFDGSTIDPIPITTEELLKSSFKYSDDLVIAGGIEVRTYGVGFKTGNSYYECNSLKCSNTEHSEGDDVLVIERSTHTIRAVEPRTGYERWNFSVGLHNIKLSKISCINLSTHLFDWNVTAILPEGKVRVSVKHNNSENSWNYIFESPVVRIWKWSGKNLSEVDLFAPRNTPEIVKSDSSFLPSIYLGMHKKQLYIHESSIMQHIIRRKQSTDVAVSESSSIAKIPWRPIPASSESSEEDSTALSVLNASEYVNGQGFYLSFNTENKDKQNLLCDTNDSYIDNHGVSSKSKTESLYYLLVPWYWRELILMVFTLFIGYFLFVIRHKKQKEIIFIEKPLEVPSVNTERRVSEREGDVFTSRYINDFDTLRCLGKGGFGVVFEVKQKIDECSYAIKRITLPNEAKDKDRVMREVKALAKLEHQNIVRYFCSWVEKPPLGWQQEHDRQWLGDKFNIETTFTTTTESKMKKRGKSVSISIEDLAPRSFDSEIPNIVQEIDDNNDDDESFIVFEHNDDSALPSDEQPSQKQDTQESSVSNIKEISYSEHIRKKIDWKRPDRKHHSWDVSQSNLINLENYEPPVFLYIQMQLCQKESLKEWLSTHHHRDYDFVKDIFAQILEAVEYVHLRGLIHRDLKPSNIFFSLDGQVKVGDFGLVKDMEDAFDLELIKKGSAPSYRGHTIEVGTQLYMSPEQFQSRIYDYKVDIYSLGLIFFELLVPFSTEMERIKMLTDVKKNIYPKEFVKNYPDEHTMLQNMLCKDPNKRLTTIGIKARPPFNREDSGYSEDCHYRLVNFQKS